MGLALRTTMNDRRANTMKTYILRDPKTVEPQKAPLAKVGRGMERAFVPSDQLGKGARPHRKAPDSPGVSTSKRLPARRGQRRPGRACSQTSPGLFPCRTFPCQRVPGRVGGAYWDGDRNKKQKAKEPERMISERSGRVQPRMERTFPPSQAMAGRRRDQTPSQGDANSAPWPFPILWRLGSPSMLITKQYNLHLTICASERIHSDDAVVAVPSIAE